MHPNHPSLKSFIEVASDSHFPIQNLPYGIFRPGIAATPRVGVAIGNWVLDLSVLEEQGLLKTPRGKGVFAQPTLNAFMALGYLAWLSVRQQISELLRDDNPTLKDDHALRQQCLIPQHEVLMEMPIAIGDYTDFYSSEYHATNAGRLFRPTGDPLFPNWKHMPVAYNGRASSVVLSGTPLHRPQGQIQLAPDQAPVFAPSQKLDFELEMGFIVGTCSRLSEPVRVNDAHEHIFGMVLLNDWSARDIQKWEYVPLGPFLSKAFGTSISPWVVTLAALEPFRVPGPTQSPQPLPYLQQSGHNHYNIQLQAQLRNAALSDPVVLCQSNHRHLYWSISQQLAHHTISGCNTRCGDLMGSGTISGPTPDSLGCLLEIAQGGQKPLQLPNGQIRTFLEDCDEITLTGWCQGGGYRVGFGHATGMILPTKSSAP